MSKWDDVMKDAQGKTGEDRRKAFQKYRGQCSCPPCPTYNECMKQHGELAFCLFDKSGCSPAQKVCFCPSCQVHQELSLQFMYYCIRGDEGAQRK